MRLRSAASRTLILSTILFLPTCEGSASPVGSSSNPGSGSEKISIASFNLQALGPTKDDWLIDNSVDTTVASSSNTYDRIVTFNASEEDFAWAEGVFRYDQVFDLGAKAPSEISDHYPVQAEFWTTKDSDQL